MKYRRNAKLEMFQLSKIVYNKFMFALVINMFCMCLYIYALNIK